MAHTDTLASAQRRSGAPDARSRSATGVAAVPHARRALAKILGNPLVGLSPWILYSVVEGPDRLELSAAVALGLAVVILSLNWIRGGTPKLLEYSDVVYFAGARGRRRVRLARDPHRGWSCGAARSPTSRCSRSRSAR